jgi:Acetyl-CoA carboxylase beta subunit
LNQAREKSELQEAVVTGTARIEVKKLALATMNVDFLMGTLGYVVGEKFVLITEYAKRHAMLLVIFSCSGGVTASFAMLGDINIAEPGAIIGFTGRRVIEQTIRKELPANFQIAEFQMERGFLDAIILRAELRRFLNEMICSYLANSRVGETEDD